MDVFTYRIADRLEKEQNIEKAYGRPPIKGGDTNTGYHTHDRIEREHQGWVDPVQNHDPHEASDGERNLTQGEHGGGLRLRDTETRLLGEEIDHKGSHAHLSATACANDRSVLLISFWGVSLAYT